MSQTTLYFLILISIHALREEGDKWACTGYDRTTISIHALREEGDATNLSSKNKSLDFYPRPPRGGRRNSKSAYERLVDISIHALREEGDFSFGF